MIARFAAGLTVLLGCGYFGILLASNYTKRVRQITEFEEAIKQLEFDIDFLNLPLLESLEKTVRSVQGTVKEILRYICERMCEDRCADSERIWHRAFKKFRYELAMTDDDVKILLDFSKNLGSGDKYSEKNNIRATLMKLKLAEDEAREIAKTNVKMYRGLGFLTGIFIVLILI